MYSVTELIADFDQRDHKKIISKFVDRKDRHFYSLKELALFCRSHTIFTSYQRETKDRLLRDNDTGLNLYEGNNLLWLDLDFEVNLVTLKRRLNKLNLKSFAYYTSNYYNNGKAHARLCVICDEILNKEEWTQVNFYADQLLTQLEFKDTIKQDKRIYNLSSYMVKVKGVYKKGDMFITEGNCFSWIKQETFIKRLPELEEGSKEEKEFIDKACFGIIGKYSSFLNSLGSIQKAIARGNGTISLSFTKLPEKTPLGYYLKLKDPWTVYHPNKKPQYLSNALSSEDFRMFKQFYFKEGLTTKDPFIDIENKIKFDEVISVPYLNLYDFRDSELLFVESPTGSGKTTAIAEWLGTQQGKSILFISVNRMQAVATSKSLKGLNFVCYLKSTVKEYQSEKNGRKKVNIHNVTFQEEAAKNIIPDRLICGVMSLHHLINKSGHLKKIFDYIIIDEVSTLPNNVSSPISLVYDRLESFELALRSFSKILKQSKKVICMDGFLSKSVVDLIINLSGKQSYLIQNNIPTNKIVEIFNCSGDQPKFEGKGTCKKFLEDITDDIRMAGYDKKRLMVVALSSKDLSETLAKYLQKTFPIKKVEKFNSKDTEELGEKVISIFEDLDGYMEQEKTDILIYSPTITTGVDIPQAKHTNVYHIISGDQLTSHTNYQMTMRGREASAYKVLIAKSLHLNKKSFENFNDYTIETLKELHKRILFKSPESLKMCLRYFKSTGLLLAYSKLSYYLSNKEWKKIIDYTSLVKALKGLKSNLEGIQVGLKIDRALILFHRELWNQGKSGYTQYLNFLKHEQCKISIEEDIDYNPSIYRPKVDSSKYKQNYIDDYSNQIKELNCWKEEYESLGHLQLRKIMKIAEVFASVKEELLRIFGKGKLSNIILLDIYEFLHHKAFTVDDDYREFLIGNTDRKKIAIVKRILSVLFKGKSIRGYFYYK